MFKSDYDFWLDYHRGTINRELTKKEYSEIRASEFAMHLLIPTKTLLKVCGGYSNMKNIFYESNSVNSPKIRKLANAFCVPKEVMAIKIACVLKQYETAQEHKKMRAIDKRRILKKENNIIYAKFN